jgi:L-threonylcarbamoyladenylate synthase
MPRGKSVHDIITNGKDMVAVRIPQHKLTIDLIEGAGVPLVGTSANTSANPAISRQPMFLHKSETG